MLFFLLENLKVSNTRWQAFQLLSLSFSNKMSQQTKPISLVAVRIRCGVGLRFTSRTWTLRALFFSVSWKPFWLVPSDIIPPPVWDLAPPLSSGTQLSSAPPTAGPDLTVLTHRVFHINEDAHWLTVASISLRDFCRLADFLQYYM